MFENFTPKQGNSLKILAAGTRNHGVLLPTPPGVRVYFPSPNLFVFYSRNEKFGILNVPGVVFCRQS